MLVCVDIEYGGEWPPFWCLVFRPTVGLEGQHPGTRRREAPTVIPVPCHYFTITQSTKPAVICGLVHHSFNSCTEPLHGCWQLNELLHNVLSIGDKVPARSFFGFLLTPGRSSLSTALYWLTAAHLESLQKTAAALLSAGNFQAWFTPDHTPVGDDTRSVCLWQLMKYTCCDITDWGVARDTLEPTLEP